ncbi:MAG: hypothetical protein ACYC9N_18855, partial [Thermoanaerobaculia bacterium]
MPDIRWTGRTSAAGWTGVRGRRGTHGTLRRRLRACVRVLPLQFRFRAGALFRLSRADGRDAFADRDLEFL